VKDISMLDEAELKAEFRQMYRELGEYEMYQVLYELFKSAELLCEVIKEEQGK
jgi:hypothetical protein